MIRVLLLVCLLCVPGLSLGDVNCDGIDDDLNTGQPSSTFLSAGTGSLVVVYAPTGTPSFGTTTACYGGEFIISDASGGSYFGMYRHGNYSGGDRMCAYNWSGGAENPALVAPYTVDVRTHLVWVHSGGNISLYKDGSLVGTVASGNTESLTHTLRVCGGVAAQTDGSIRGHGRIIEVKTYNVALTAGQIAAEGTSAVRNVIPVTATARWNFDTCTLGAQATVAFPDRSGNGRSITPSAGTDTLGMACVGSSIPYQWGVW